ncbi:MAG: hypothetical protein C0508_10950 [Cyanobacteria bacterium PR.023]|nr:hypothetical protein [Cyanobacteria bacterium PR.023]MDQ5938092.1 hypothetical protein [Cyanobacteriota bacterium erpe_2018_sw_21hr_WHONDRS-SW48-000092_B_bin.40]
MIRFGELLVRLSLVSERDLTDALQVAPQFGLPLGRTLVLSGRISESELQLAVELQPLIGQNICSLERAKEAAKLVRGKGLLPAEALKRIGVQGATDKATLGCLLVDAGFLSAEQVDNAQKISYETGMRLGRVLILNNLISHSLLTQALDLQGMVRQGRMSLPQAVEMLVASAPKHALPANISLRLEAHGLSPSPAKKQVRFGEFLVMSGLASENEILNAMETSLSKQLSLGEAIVALGLISQSLFKKAESLHEQVSQGEVTLKQATDEIYRLIHGDKGGSKAGSADSDSLPSPVLGELLKMTGFVNDTDITEAIELSSRYPALIGKMLVVSGAIDEATLIASLRCQYLLKHRYLAVDQAVQALQYTRKNKVSFDDAMEELGIAKPSGI